MLTSFTYERTQNGVTVVMNVDLKAMAARLTLTKDGATIAAGLFNPSWHGFETPEGVAAFFDYPFTKWNPVECCHYEIARIDWMIQEATPAEPEPQQIAA